MSIGHLVAVPELAAEGAARLLEQQGELSKIKFLNTGAEMTQETRRVVRYPLLPGTEVRWRKDGIEASGIILPMAPRSKNGRLLYAVESDGKKVGIDESWISCVEEPADPFDRLSTAHFHDLVPIGGRGGGHKKPLPLGPRLFAARERLFGWRGEAWARSGGVMAWLARVLSHCRIKFVPRSKRCVAHKCARCWRMKWVWVKPSKQV